MPLPFHEVRFPEEISYGSQGGPTFNTTVFTSRSGFEQRNSNWQVARAKYDVSHGIKSRADMEEILNFFYAMRGKATGFRYKDWLDYQLDNGFIGLGDGSTTEFQIIKRYAVGESTGLYTRVLRKIVEPTAGPPAVVFAVYNESVLVPDTDYTIDYDTGIITFDTAPLLNETITVTCEFDVPVRFDIDEMPVTLEAFELDTWDSIPLVEIKTNA